MREYKRSMSIEGLCILICFLPLFYNKPLLLSMLDANSHEHIVVFGMPATYIFIAYCFVVMHFSRMIIGFLIDIYEKFKMVKMI